MTDDRERNDQGRYVSTITPESVLEVLREDDDPVLTAKEVGERLGCTSEAARQRLHDLNDSGMVETKTVGARARIWWPADG